MGTSIISLDGFVRGQDGIPLIEKVLECTASSVNGYTIMMCEKDGSKYCVFAVIPLGVVFSSPSSSNLDYFTRGFKILSITEEPVDETKLAELLKGIGKLETDFTLPSAGKAPLILSGYTRVA